MSTVNTPSTTSNNDNPLLRSAPTKGQPSANAKLDELTSSLYGIIPKVLAVVDAFNDEKDVNLLPSLSTVVRSFLLAGAGRGFSPTYQHAIRHYNYADDALRMWERKKGSVSDSVVADNMSRWNRELRDREHTLTLLGVEIIDVKAGDPLDAQMHLVAPGGMLETSSSRKLNTIAQVNSPAFRWTDEHGETVIEPANVLAFCNHKSSNHAAIDAAYGTNARKPR